MNIYLRTTTILILISLLSSCKKSFLEVAPKEKLIASSVGDFDLIMNGAAFYEFLGGGGWEVAVMMGDDIAVEENYYIRANPITQRIFRWDDVIYVQPTDAAADLRNLLPSIYVCNKIVNEVMKANGGTEQQKKVLLAEAKATRAWINFQLINAYAKPYLEATAGSDLGFPIIKDANIREESFSRGTVKEMYDFIIQDLRDAIADLPVQNKIQTRMSKPAAEGLLGKVYLFMGKSLDAMPLLDAAFRDISFWTTTPRLYNYNTAFNPGGAFLPIGQNGPNSPYNNKADFTESIVAKIFSNTAASGSNGVVVTPATIALYGASDLRLKFYSPTFFDGSVNPKGRLRRYGVSFSKFGLELAELYLLRSESRARLNNLGGAKEDLEILRRNRMPAADAVVPAETAADQTSLIKFIIDERGREFAAEGYRWYDMRRLSVDPIFKGQEFKHTLYLSSGNTTVYTLNQPNRLALQLPANIMIANPSFTNNP